MAILRGFPPSNTISPGTRISAKDLAAMQPPKKKFGDKNPWLQRKNSVVGSKPVYAATTDLTEELKAISRAAFQAAEADRQEAAKWLS